MTNHSPYHVEHARRFLDALPLTFDPVEYECHMEGWNEPSGGHLGATSAVQSAHIARFLDNLPDGMEICNDTLNRLLIDEDERRAPVAEAKPRRVGLVSGWFQSQVGEIDMKPVPETLPGYISMGKKPEMKDLWVDNEDLPTTKKEVIWAADFRHPVPKEIGMKEVFLTMLGFDLPVVETGTYVPDVPFADGIVGPMAMKPDAHWLQNPIKSVVYHLNILLDDLNNSGHAMTVEQLTAFVQGSAPKLLERLETLLLNGKEFHEKNMDELSEQGFLTWIDKEFGGVRVKVGNSGLHVK